MVQYTGTMTSKPAILFVCLGNICRSPLAEGAFRKAAEDAGLDIEADSVGTAGYHIGEPPDPRSVAEAAKHGVDIAHYRGRQLAQSDFSRFTHIYAMDNSNLTNLRAVAPPDTKAEIALLLDAVPGREGAEVSDPYYGGEEGFEFTWGDVNMAADAIVARLKGLA